MLRTVRILAFAGLLAITAAFGLTLAMSQEEHLLAAVYEMIFGPPDLGPVDFETLVRSAKPNTALACPQGFCQNATADFDPGVYSVSDEALREAFTRHALAQPGVIPVYRHSRPGLPTQDRYVQRSALMQFPDTVDVRFIALSDTTSTLAIYSRSQIGQSDLGVNLKRIRLWTNRTALGVP
jgi:uncharacterized protein (DUF1499 family)